MTTDKTIEEMNRAIAEFMGLKFRIKDYPNGQQNVNEIDIGGYWATCKYHEDWNQLHAIWDRYKKLEFADPKQEQLHSEMKSLISVAICYSDILHAHKLFYDSIVFYTTTKQKD